MSSQLPRRVLPEPLAPMNSRLRLAVIVWLPVPRRGRVMDRLTGVIDIGLAALEIIIAGKVTEHDYGAFRSSRLSRLQHGFWG